MTYKKLLLTQAEIENIERLINKLKAGNYNREAFEGLSQESEKFAIEAIIESLEQDKNGESEYVDASIDEIFDDVIKRGLSKKKYEDRNVEASPI